MPSIPLWDQVQDAARAAGRAMGASIDEKMIPRHDAAADRAIANHQAALTATLPPVQRVYFRHAQEACREVMKAACDADGAIPQHIERVMRLVNYRIPGAVFHADIAKIMALGNSQARENAFNQLFDAIAAEC